MSDNILARALLQRKDEPEQDLKDAGVPVYDAPEDTDPLTQHFIQELYKIHSKYRPQYKA